MKIFRHRGTRIVDRMGERGEEKIEKNAAVESLWRVGKAACFFFLRSAS